MQRINIVILALVALMAACSQESTSTIPSPNYVHHVNRHVHRHRFHPHVIFPNNIPIHAYVGTPPFTTRFPWGDPGPTVAEKYLTYAESVPVANAQIMNNDCIPSGFCKPLYYFDPHIIACTTTQDTAWYNAAQNQANDNWFTHASPGPASPSDRAASAPSPTATWCPNTTNYISAPYVEYYPYADSPGNQNFWITNVFGASNVQANTVFYEDDVFLYPTPHPGLEYSSLTALLQAEGDEINAYAPNKVVCNCLGPGGGNYGANGTTGHFASTTALFATYATKGNLIAGTFEKPIVVPSPMSSNNLNADNIPIVINTASRVLNNTSAKLGVLDLTDQATGSDPTAERILHIALVWLIQDYANDDPTRIISNEIPGSSPLGQVGIYPEELIVPSGSLQQFRLWKWSGNAADNGSGCIASGNSAVPDPNSSGGVMDVLLACSDGGVALTFIGGGNAALYAREFTDCYYNNIDQGGCAAVINTSNRMVTTRSSWNFVQTFKHEITVSGGPINAACPTVSACNGTISFKSTPYTPGSTKIPPNSAILLTVK